MVLFYFLPENLTGSLRTLRPWKWLVTKFFFWLRKVHMFIAPLGTVVFRFKNGFGKSKILALINQKSCLNQISFKVRSLLEHSCATLISFKISDHFQLNISCALFWFQLMLYWKLPQFWKNMGIAQLCLKSELNLAFL